MTATDTAGIVRVDPEQLAGRVTRDPSTAAVLSIESRPARYLVLTDRQQDIRSGQAGYAAHDPYRYSQFKVDGTVIPVHAVGRDRAGWVAMALVQATSLLFQPDDTESLTMPTEGMRRFMHELNVGRPLFGDPVVERWRDEMYLSFWSMYTQIVDFAAAADFTQEATTGSDSLRSSWRLRQASLLLASTLCAASNLTFGDITDVLATTPETVSHPDLFGTACRLAATADTDSIPAVNELIQDVISGCFPDELTRAGVRQALRITGVTYLNV